MIIYEVIQYGLALIATILIGYQLLLSLVAFISEKNETIHTVYNRSFLVIVRSHNKEQVLAQTLYSLSGLVYPWNLYKLVIIADNCTDNTAEITRKLGLQVLEWDSKHKHGRNYALDWALDKIWQWDEKYDAIVIIEAGSLISSNFLKIMNYYIGKGSEIIQSSNLVLVSQRIWKTKLIRIALLLHNNVNPLGRKALGLNIGLNGNGMCFRSNILMKYPFKIDPSTEDWEYSLSLFLKGVNIDFAPEARVWSQISDVSLKNKLYYTIPRGMRYATIKKYINFLLIHPFTKRSIHLLEMLLGFITPPMVILFSGAFAVLVVNIVLWMLGFVSILFVWIWLVITVMGGVYFLIGVIADRVMATHLSRK